MTRAKLLVQFGRHGRSPDSLREVESILDRRPLGAGLAVRAPRDQLAAAAELGWIDDRELQALCEAEDFYWRIVAGERLLLDGAFSPEAVGAGGVAHLLRATGEAGLDALEARLQQVRDRTAEILSRALEA